MKIISASKFLYVVIVIALMIFAASFLVFKTIKVKSENISSMTRELEEETSKESRYRTIRNVIMETKTDREKIDSYFVKDDKIIDFIEQVEEQGKISSATTTIVSLMVEEGSKKASSTVEVLSVEIEAGGRWKNIYHFLSLVENLPYSIWIENMALREDSEIDGYWTVNFMLKTLKLKK